jgi:hypothetical protein
MEKFRRQIKTNKKFTYKNMSAVVALTAVNSITPTETLQNDY